VIGLVAAVTSMWGGFAAFTVTIFTVGSSSASLPTCQSANPTIIE
jgi:hypothetical protein